MRLSNKWFTALSENEQGEMIMIRGREELDEFIQSGKLKERAEITWKYEGDNKKMPTNEVAEVMEQVEEALDKVMEKDKLAIHTSTYTGGNEKVWVYYARTTRVFGERLNEALAPFELLPIEIYTEIDPTWDEYNEMAEMREFRLE
jgi:hypothetical protein